MAATDKNMTFDVNLLPATTGDHNLGSSELKWKINGVADPKLTDTNTWRGIQDNLTSSSNTTESLSAKQGYLLANGSARDNTKVSKSGDTMTGNLIAPSIRIANTYYGITYGRTNDTPVETILHTGIKWMNGHHMPIIHITGYAYGLQSPVEFKIGFYIYGDKIGWCSVTNMGAWQPNVYLFKDNHDNYDYVGVGLAGSCYFLQLQADLQDEMGKFADIDTNSSKWSWTFSTTAGVIPAADDGTTCIQVPYRANILNPSQVNGHTVEANVPSNAKFTDTTDLTSMTGTLAIEHGGTGATTAANAWAALGGGASGKHADSYFVKAITSTDNAIVRFDGTSGQVQNSGVTIDDNNNVTISGETLRITNTSGGRYILMGNQDSAGTNCPFIIEAVNGSLYLGNGTNWSSPYGGTFSSYLCIQKNGNIGIGTNSSSYKLSVNGDVSATNFRGALIGNADTATTASKLSNTSAIGGTDRPVYFTNGGVPAQTTYRMAGTNATATGGLTYSNNLDTGIWYVNGITAADNPSNPGGATDGVIYAEKYSDNWIHEIYGDYRTGQIAVRGKNNGTWQAWRKVLDSSNWKTLIGATTAAASATKYLREDGSWQVPIDTKNTAGSTNSTSKLFLIGATSQATNPTTNSYQYTYTTNGLLSSAQLGLNVSGTEKVHMEWNATDQSIDFVFN